ncbi:MAG: hypothetical protein IK117_05845 [Bacteroidales bacterium]|nr:hypothetical protein [Bacteroidales bacterium]
MPKKVFSKHWFLFSFSFPEGETETSISNKLELLGWERKRFNYTDDYKNNFALQNSVLFYGCGAMFDDSTSSNRVLAVYDYLQGCGGNYIIEKDGTTYSLRLNRVELRVYANFVGVLVFHVENEDESTYKSYSKIQEINEYGRHIFPPYITDKKTVCPQSITVTFTNGYTFKQDFSQYEQVDEEPFQLPEFIKQILPVEYHKCTWLCDDSMFYVSVIYQQNMLYGRHLTDVNYGYHCEIKYSSLEITKVSSNDMDFLETLYLNIAELVLAQQACYLRFLRKLSVISQSKQGNWFKRRKFLKQLQELHHDYLLFVDNMCYNDISPKRVGNELYHKLQTQSKIQRNKKTLQKNIKQLYDMAHAERLKNLQIYLAIVAALVTITMGIVQIVFNCK